MFASLRRLDPGLKEGAFARRIFDLRESNLSKTWGKGIYTLKQKQSFKRKTDQVVHEIGSFLNSLGNHHDCNIWSTARLNEFRGLQATSFFYILEVDRRPWSNTAQ
ncbi:DUF6577 family protein [Puia sp.]|uniref:DUF6577 family protein n=1 Tax=Puia sp. TaxID=2045100 RepID=UPI0039C9B9A6